MADIRKILLQGDEAPYDIMPARIDATPTANSTNMVASGDIKTYVDTTEANAKTYTDTECGAIAKAGAKNLCPYDTLIATAPGTVVDDQPINLPAGTYILSFKRTATTGSTAFRFLYDGTSIHTFTIYNSGSASKSMEFTLSLATNQFRVYTSIANTYTEMMIRRKEITDATYQLYAPTNRELYENTMTKNLCASSFGSQKVYNVIFAAGADGSITVNGQASQTASIAGSTFLLKAGTYIFSGASGSNRDSTYDSYVYDIDHSKTVARDNPNDAPGTMFTLTQDTNVRVTLRVASGYNASNVVFRPMIRRAWDTDTTYQPYVPTDNEAVWGIGTPIPNGTDLNDYQTIGIYYRNADSNQLIPANVPENSNYFKLIVECVYAPVGRPKQTFVMLNQSGTYYTRVLTKDGWTQWQRFVSTENMLDRGKQITASEYVPLDIHTVATCGRYYFVSDDTNYMTNLPFTGTGGEFVVEQMQGPNRIKQTFYPLYINDAGRSAGEFYVSLMYSGIVNNYVKLTTKPSDWASAYYVKYYTKDGTTYNRIPHQETPPTFVANTYYELSETSWTPWYKFEGTVVASSNTQTQSISPQLMSMSPENLVNTVDEEINEETNEEINEEEMR